MHSIAAERANRLERLAVLRDQDYVNVGTIYESIDRYIKAGQPVPPSLFASYDAAKAAYERSNDRIILLLMSEGR